MKIPRVQFSIRFALLVTTFAALLLFWFQSRPTCVEFSFDSMRNRTLVLEPYACDQDYREATVSITNRSPYAIWYWGDTFRSRPDHVILQEYHNRWNQCGWSTNTSKWVELPRGKSLSVRIQLLDETTAFKVGLTFKGARYGESSKKWSDGFSIEATPVER